MSDPPSPQELELVRLLAEGHTDESVARRLGWTRRTMQRRLSELMNQLGAISRFQAGVLAERRGWTSMEPASPAAHPRQLDEQEPLAEPSKD